MRILMTEDDDRIGIDVLTLLGQEQASQRGLHVQHAEEVSGHVVGHEPVGSVVDAETVNADLVSRQIGEHILCLIANHPIIGYRELILGVALSLAVGDHADLLRMRHRHRTQQQPVHQAEDRGVGSDPQRKRKRCHNRERPAFAQHSQSIQNVALEGIHGNSIPHAPAFTIALSRGGDTLPFYAS